VCRWCVRGWVGALLGGWLSLWDSNWVDSIDSGAPVEWRINQKHK